MFALAVIFDLFVFSSSLLLIHPGALIQKEITSASEPTASTPLHPPSQGK
jgi:hypothetical protein